MNNKKEKNQFNNFELTEYIRISNNMNDRINITCFANSQQLNFQKDSYLVFLNGNV